VTGMLPPGRLRPTETPTPERKPRRSRRGGCHNVVADPENMPDDAGLWCPFDQTDRNIKCGDCRVCLEPDGPDVYIELETKTSGPGTPEE